MNMKPHFVLFACSSYYYKDECVSVCLEMAKQFFIFLVQDGLRVRLEMWISGRKEPWRRHYGGIQTPHPLPVLPLTIHSLGPWVVDGYIPLC